MRILIIGKYPPIEGGVSSRTYWLARGLAEKGHHVDIVTNALRVEGSYKLQMDPTSVGIKNSYEPTGTTVYSFEDPLPIYIPYSESYVSRLVGKGLEVIEKNRPDILFTNYLEPYGAAGLFLKKLTGIPLVVQHAGSDIYRLLPQRELSPLLARVLQEADGVFLSQRLSALAKTLALQNLLERPPFAIHPAFSPEGPGFEFGRYEKITPPRGVPTVTYLGKIGPRKGLRQLCSALARTSHEFRLLLFANGRTREWLDTFLNEHPSLKERSLDIGFVPPWEIPAVLRSTTVLSHLEFDFPIPIHSPVQPFEAIACETPLLLSKEIHGKIKGLLPNTADHIATVQNPADIDDLQMQLETLLSSSKKTADAKQINKEFMQHSHWDTFLEKHIEAFEHLRKPALAGFFRR